VVFKAVEFNPTPRDFEHMTVTGLINRLRQIVLYGTFPNLLLVGSSLGALVGIHYAHRFGGVDRLLLLAPALAFRGMDLTEAEVETWRRKGARMFMHYDFEREVPLRYDYYRDGMEYSSPIPPPAPTEIIHGVHDDVVPIAHSRKFAAEHKELVKLLEVDSDHRLADRMPLLWEQVEAFLANRKH
jgi:pimeloyl-ACP methyl ester carboxylesterase